MNLKVGIVGLPNTGKSTLFNALLKKQQALVASYPFATIEPNVGIVPVPDSNLSKLAFFVEKEVGKTPKTTPEVISFVDIAGLVRGAHKGEGLGNQFLSHIREVDLILHVLRFFKDDSVSHPHARIDPLQDKKVVEHELILADLATLDKQKPPKGTLDKEGVAQWNVVEKLKNALSKDKPARDVLQREELSLVKHLHLLSAKPMLYVCNVSESSFNNKNAVLNQPQPSVSLSAKLESELNDLPEKEEKEYRKSFGTTKSALSELIIKAYKTLDLITFYTITGGKEVRAWHLRKGKTAFDAAGVVHSDMQKGFIKAETISIKQLLSAGSWKNAKNKGLVQLQGKEYVVQDKDVVEIRFNK